MTMARTCCASILRHISIDSVPLNATQILSNVGNFDMTEKLVSRAGVLANVIFWGALFAFAALYPGYTHSHKAISELGAFGAPNALAWNLVGFIIPGILLALCGSAIAIRVDGQRTALYWLLILSGLGFSGAGIFPAEMRDGSPAMDSAWTMGHIIMSFVSGIPWIIASAILVQHVKRSPKWQRFTRICLILTLLAIASLVTNIAGRGLPLLAENPGLVQRIAFAFYFAWFLIAGYLFSNESAPEINPSA